MVSLFPLEGYGFLQDAAGRSIYFHKNSLVRTPFQRLEIGTPVRYAEEEGTEGPQAASVIPLRRQEGS